MKDSGTDNRVSRWVEIVVLAVLGYVANSGVTSLKELTSNVNELNQKMAVMLEHITGQDKILDEHNQRIHALEGAKRGER